jgi:prevent-host-death family protein
MIRTDAIRPLTDFKRRTAEISEELRHTGRPLVLTVNGSASLVVQDAAAYQRLLDELDRLEAIEGIREGLASLDRQDGSPLDVVANRLRSKFGSDTTV